MRHLSAVALLALAAGAYAQDAAKPPAPAVPPPEPPPKPTVFLPEGIRKPDGMIVQYYRVNYVSAEILAKELQSWKSAKAVVAAMDAEFAPAPIAPPRPGAAAAVPVRNVLRIEETEENLPLMLKVLDRIDVPQMQAYVEAKIVEITYTDDLRYGVEAHVKRTLADTFFQGADIRFPNRLDAVNQFTSTFRDSGASYVFDYVVDLAEAGAKTTITSKPGVFVAQGETATIRVGDSEPIVQQQLSGTTITATTIFKDTGLRLDVQPLMIGRDAIRARISAEQSRVSQFRVTATSTDLQVVNPVIATRSADTALTIPDGESIAIGGLDQHFEEESSTGIPLLKDIPVVGFFFGSTTKKKAHTELVFFLTFTITSPSESKVVKPPAEKERSGE